MAVEYAESPPETLKLAQSCTLPIARNDGGNIMCPFQRNNVLIFIASACPFAPYRHPNRCSYYPTGTP